MNEGIRWGEQPDESCDGLEGKVREGEPRKYPGAYGTGEPQLAARQD